MTPELQDIIDRHEATLKACSGKLMNAEKDLSVVLKYLADEMFLAGEVRRHILELYTITTAPAIDRARGGR